MKTVLVITTEESHRFLYETGLKKHFSVSFAPKLEGGLGNVDAVVYDIPSRFTSVDFRWLQETELPVVVLTPERSFPLPQASRQCALTYPVTMDKILRALAKLGVEGEETK
jgi:hypothetical protein